MRKRTRFGIVYGILIILFGIIVWMYYSRNQIRDLPQILESGRLSVLTDSSSMGFSVKGDSVSGFQYEIVKAFADNLGVELVMTEENDLNKSVNDLKSGDYDMIANAIPTTTEWKNDLLFSTPLFNTRQVLVQRLSEDTIIKRKLIKNQVELANDTIYVPAHSPYKMRLMHLSDEIASNIVIVEMNNLSSEQMVHLVVSGGIKQTICDEQFAEKMKLMYPNLDVSLPIGFPQQQSWAVHTQSTQLLEKLNEFLADFMGSSAYWEIYRKYYK